MPITKTTAVTAALAVTITAGAALANDPIAITISGTLSGANGSDGDPARTGALSGASFSLTGTVTPEDGYVRSLNLPAAVFNDGAELAISGATSPGYDGVYLLDPAAFYPTIAGLFSHPDGFLTGVDAVHATNAATLNVFGFFGAASGANDAEIGRIIETDDFEGATDAGFSITLGADTYSAETLSVSAATVPTPGVAAIAGLGGLIATRRRR